METTRREFLQRTGCGVMGLYAGAQLQTSAKADTRHAAALERPNILLLMTDQQRFDSLGCYGCKAVDTPHLDRLAKEGALFEHCYAPNPICTPTRASLMTGKHLPGHGVYKLHDILPDDQVMFSKRLQELGYETALVGKLHVSGLWHEAEQRHPNDGFEHYHWCVDPGLNFDSPFNAYAGWVRQKDLVFYQRLTAEGKTLRHFPSHLHNTRWAVDTVLELMESRDRARPFFTLMSLFDPHDPYFDYPKEAVRQVRTEQIPAAQPLPDDSAIPAGVQQELDKSAVIKQSATFHEPVSELRKGYYASIAFLDQEIGRVLDYLDESGLAESTLVIFVSDHGDMLFDRGLFSKGAYFYDPSIRVPLLMRFPLRVPAGRRISDPVQVHDLAATIMAAAGVQGSQIGQWMPDSQNLLAPLAGNAAFREYAVCLFRNTGYGPGGKYFDPPVHASMLRDNRYKLVVYHTTEAAGLMEGELFDMQADPLETRNLWTSQTHQSTRQRLLGQLLDWIVRQEIAHLGTRGGERFRTQSINYYGDKKGDS
jgi:arylsulfatase